MVSHEAHAPPEVHEIVSASSVHSTNLKCTSFPTSACRLLKDINSTSKSKVEIAAATLGQLVNQYYGAHGLNGATSESSLEPCCTSRLDAIWGTITEMHPSTARTLLRCVRIAIVLKFSPPSLQDCAIRAHVNEKEALLLSRQLHGVPCEKLVPVLSNFTYLLRVDMSHNALTEDDMPNLGRALRCMTALLHLDLSSNSICEDGAQPLANALCKLKHLRSLSLNSTLLEDEGVEYIANALATPLDIRHLALAMCGITSEGAISLQVALRALPKLSVLDLHGNDLQGNGVALICDSIVSQRLSYLDVAENSLGGEGVMALASFIPKLSLSHLHHLDLSANGLEVGDSASLASALKCTAASLTSIILSDNDLQDDGLLSLQPALSCMSALRSVNISGNEITDVGLSQATRSLVMLSSLRKLDISYQPVLKGSGVSALSEILRKLTALSSLMLISTALDTDGAVSLGRELPQAVSLCSLHLSHNQIGAEGTSAIFSAISLLPTLTHVSVGYADLGPRCVSTIGPALQKATQLHFIDLRYNALRVYGTISLMQHLKHLKRLKSLVLEGNGVEESDDVRSVNKALPGVKVWLNVGARIA